MVLALSFEEGAGQIIKDRSGNGNDAKIDGNGIWVDGKIAGGFKFDGKTWLIAPHIPLNERNFTIQFWFKSNLSANQQVIISQYEKNAKNLSLHCRVYNTGQVRLGFYGNDHDSDPNVVKKDTWHNLTFWVNHSKKERKIYVDGKEITASRLASNYLAKTGKTIVGGWNRVDKNQGKGYQVYMGVVDEVRIWLRTLTDEEIVDSMDTPMPVEKIGKITTTWTLIKTKF